MAGLNMNSSLRKSPTRPADIQSPSQKTYAGIVFNPYEVTSYTNNKRIESICNNQAICEYYVSNMMLSGGKLNSDKAEGYYVYFYRVSAINIAYWLQQVGINDEEPNKQLLCFYDKAIVSLLNKEKKTGDAVLCAVKKEDEELFGYFHLGKGAVQKKNEEYLYSRSIIPREFFESINDYVYIAICSKEETAPVVILQEIPCGIPTFWDLPVATALYEKQHLYDSHIVLGSVRVFSKKTNSRPTSMPRSEIVEEDRWDLDPSFTYTWIRPSQTVSLNKKPYFRTMKTSAYVLIYKEEAYRCPSVEVNIYKDKLSEGASSFFAFSFRSGNEDDLVKKSYLTEKDPYNAYSLLLDSLSVATVFCSFPSIKKPIENAARYLLRTLAKQPVGLRCLSIDGAPLSALMGGALYEIGAIVSQSKETIEANSDYLWALAKMNDSQLFYNSPVRYDISARGKSNAELNRALFFLKTVLGIQENSSGCERIKELLKDLFKFFKDNHVEINYFFSDIELMSSGSRALALRRFKEAYAKLFSEDLSSFLTDIVVPELERKIDGWENEEFQRRGYWGNRLLCIKNVPDDPKSEFSPYGLNQKHYYLSNEGRNKSYAERRNINVWDSIMRTYDNELVARYIFDPSKEMFGSIKCGSHVNHSSKGYLNVSGRYEQYLGGSTKLRTPYYSTAATYVGDTFSRLYKKLCMDNWRMHPNSETILSYMMDIINAHRLAHLSSAGRLITYIAPWMYFNEELMKRTTIGNQINTFCESYGTLLNEKTIVNAYNTELLYHIFLTNPEIVIAYLPFPARDGLVYSFPDEPKSEKTKLKYYNSSHEEMQKILSSINEIVGIGKRKTIVNEIAVETEPYILSGIEANGRFLWRLSCDVLSGGRLNIVQSETGARVTIKDVTLFFPQGKTDNHDTPARNLPPKLGIWIETPVGVYPKRVANVDYYKKSPAFQAVLSSPEKLPSGITMSNNDEIVFDKFRTYTVFGELPKNLLCSLRFEVKESLGNGKSATLLYSTNIIDGYGRKCEAIIGNLNGDVSDSKTVLFRLRFNNVYKQKCALTIGEQYELKLFAILHNDPYSSKVSKTWVYSLHHVNNGKTEANQIMHFSFGKAIDNTEGIPSLYFGSLALFKPSDASVYNSIKLDSFKVYFVDHHEKIELFRESDGVNVSRVNIDNSFYKEMPVNTKPDDSLICKISWLNATNDDIKYRIAYLEDDLPINMFYKRQNTNIVFPTDGSVVDMSSFQHDGRFTVAANSEGYILVDLPKHAKNVERVKVQLSYEGIGETGQLMHPLPQFRRASADDLLVTKYRDDSFDTHTAEAIFDAEFIPIPR